MYNNIGVGSTLSLFWRGGGGVAEGWSECLITDIYHRFIVRSCDRVGLPLQGFNCIRAESLRSEVIPGVTHMRGMQYQIVLNIAFYPEFN